MTPISTTKIVAQLCLGLLVTLGSTSTLAQQLSPSEAAASARNITGGKILKVRPMKGSRVDYRVKVLSPEGRVRNIIVDGNSGKVRFRNTHTDKPNNETNTLRKGFQ
jgi:hypothetical protein